MSHIKNILGHYLQDMLELNPPVLPNVIYLPGTHPRGGSRGAAPSNYYYYYYLL